MQIKKILCAVDFSPVSDKVADYAKSLAGPLDAEIICIHVVPSGTIYADFGIPMNSMESFCTTMITEGEKTLAAFNEKHFYDKQYRAKVTCGDFSEQILACAKEEQVDMIVMGTHGRKGMDKLLFGSVAEKVLRQAPCPVVAIRPS
ncbi:Nucleotide-binding universal stress protein, UspA family [Desulfonatronum thiosulfatophilum]|uniref:Universal stress protein n=2 Tax=Desulfonatronum thiosulfatophilum TaxID=617002 RepID=A0A1G6CW62_9BACT|nr:Nucleotide-binding universal stress protein, UspA family [Desulfonatronum thiosulfatophilum]